MLFKKAISTGSKNVLGNKDRKKLRSIVVKSFPACSEKQVDDVLLREEDTFVMKVQGSKTLIYFSAGEPMFFDVDGAGMLCPSIYALLRLPDLLSCFLIYESVSKFVLGGADLMVPGVIKPKSTDCYGPDGLLTKKLMGVRVWGNPIPFAVGRCAVTNADFMTGRGKALDIFHVYGDALWNLGSRPVVNHGFASKRIAPLQPPHPEDTTWYGALVDAQEQPASSDAPDDDGWGTLDRRSSMSSQGTFPDYSFDDDIQRTADCLENINLSDIPPSPTLGNDPSSDLHEDNDTVASPCEDVCSAAPAAPPAHVQPQCQFPLALMDLFFELVLLEVLHNHLPDSSCPLPISAVFSKMTHCASVVQFHPRVRDTLTSDIPYAREIAEGTVLLPCDVKKTSYKKLTKFFQAYTKKKLIVTKDVRGDLQLVGIKRDCPLYRDYIACTDKDRKYAARRCTATSNGSASVEPSAPVTSSTNDQEYRVFEFYRPTSSSQPIFEGVQPEVSGYYYTPQQCRHALSQYLEAQKLVVNNAPSMARLDTVLQNCVLPKDLRKTMTTETVMSRAELATKFLASLQSFHAVTKGDGMQQELAIRRDKLKPIRLGIEKRQGRKAVTTIANLQAFDIDEKYLAETLQRALASSATTYELTGAAKGKTKPLGVMVQGSFVDAIAEILVTQFGIPKRFIAQ